MTICRISTKNLDPDIAAVCATGSEIWSMGALGSVKGWY